MGWCGAVVYAQILCGHTLHSKDTFTAEEDAVDTIITLTEREREMDREQQSSV